MAELTPAEQLALWSDKLRDISALGLRYASRIYELEDYKAVQDMAVEMLALASGETVEAIEPLRTPHFSRPTPLSVGEAAVIDKNGRILLIQRSDNEMWAMPGGMLEVGESPAEGVVRETYEETGVHCVAKSLVGVYDSRFLGGRTRFHLYHFTFLCEPVKNKGVEVATFAHETLGHDWFLKEDLLTPIDPSHGARIVKAFQMWRDGGEAFFDVPSE